MACAPCARSSTRWNAGLATTVPRGALNSRPPTRRRSDGGVHGRGREALSLWAHARRSLRRGLLPYDGMPGLLRVEREEVPVSVSRISRCALCRRFVGGAVRCPSMHTIEDGRRYGCNRPRGHEGDHESCLAWPVSTWPNREPAPEPARGNAAGPGPARVRRSLPRMPLAACKGGQTSLLAMLEEVPRPDAGANQIPGEEAMRDLPEEGPRREDVSELESK